MKALFAHETEFWMWLRTTDSFVSDLEWHYHCSVEAMTENYCNLTFPPMELQSD